MKIIGKLTVFVIALCSLAITTAFSQTTTLNVSVDDQTTGGTAPFTYNINVGIDNGQYSGSGEYEGADSDTMPVVTDYPSTYLPATWTCSIVKTDVYHHVVGVGYDTGTISWNGQIVEIKVIDP